MRPVVERCSLGGFTAALAAVVAVCAATAPYADAVHAAGRCRPRPHRPVLGLNVEALADPGKAQLDVDLAPLVGGCRSPALFDAVRVSTISASRPLVWRFHHVRGMATPADAPRSAFRTAESSSARRGRSRSERAGAGPFACA